MARPTITKERVKSRLFFNSMDFGGQNSGAYVEFPYLFDPSATDFTAAHYFRVHKYTTALPIIQSITTLSQTDGSGVGRGWIGVRNTTGALEDSFNGASTTTPYIVSSLEWLHVVITYDLATSTRRFYINGELIHTAVITIESANGLMRIGSNKNSQRNIVGRITELRIWDRRLTDADVADYYFKNSFSRDDLQLEALFTEGSGATVADTSGNGNNGTVVSATWTTDVPPFQQRSVVSTPRSLISTPRALVS